ncbi:hypothetical protein PN499_03965 [Kamptonema animale CS-326]|nr:hypothetical protein [Kamptonema animale]MDB9510358.1 hypothetical protein [Kamptonema animale CS-326]
MRVLKGLVKDIPPVARRYLEYAIALSPNANSSAVRLIRQSINEEGIHV